MATDPFDSLREPLAPLAPRPSFVADLRARLRVALMPVASTPATAFGAADSPASPSASRTEETPVPEPYEYTPTRLRSITPYLCCRGAEGALAWYQEVFGAVVLSGPIMMDDGRLGHVELRIGESVIFMADEFPEIDVVAPPSLGGTSVSLQLYVPDARATYDVAVARGAAGERPLGEAHGALMGTLRDPWGHRWFIGTHLVPDDVPVEDVSGRRYGDVGYLTLGVPDGPKAAAFYGQLFGWRTEVGGEPGSFHIATITPPAGIHQGGEGVRLYFRVDDIATATARVVELGGQVLAIMDYDSGGNAECVDDQGVRFDLFRPRPGY